MEPTEPLSETGSEIRSESGSTAGSGSGFGVGSTSPVPGDPSSSEDPVSAGDPRRAGEPVWKVTTYLEMADPGQLVPARPVPGLTIEQVDRTSPLIVEISARIGAPYGWRHTTRTDDEWADWLSHPDREYWLIRHEAEIVGMAELEPQADGAVEITTFGLVPEHVGKGLGGYALTLALQRAWQTEPRDTGSVRRVWLHTSSGDHPNALPNYRRRGLRPYQTRTWPSGLTEPFIEAVDEPSPAPTRSSGPARAPAPPAEPA